MSDLASNLLLVIALLVLLLVPLDESDWVD